MLDPLRHSVLNAKNEVTLNHDWQTFMLVNDTSDKELLDLLAASDRPLPYSVIDKAIMKDLHLESLRRAVVVNQKVRVEQSYELLNSMVSSGLALKQQKSLLLSLLGEFKYDRFEHIEGILNEVGSGGCGLGSIDKYCLLEKEVFERRVQENEHSLLCRGEGNPAF